MSTRRRFRDLLKTRVLSRSSSSDRRLQNSAPISPSPAVLDPEHSLQDLASNGLEPSSSANGSYSPLVPEALTSRNNGNQRASGNRLKEMGATGWNTLETVLSTVNGASGAFPPLQAAVGGLLGVMKQIDVRVFTT